MPGRRGGAQAAGFRSLLVAAVLALGLFGGWAPTAGADVVVDFQPTVDTLVVGQELTLSVCVDASALGLKTFQVAFAYDASVLEVLDVSVGELLRDSGAPTFFQTLDTIDSVVVIASVLGPGVAVDGPGEIYAVRFRALSPGQSQHVFQGIVLLDNVGGELEPVRQDGAWLVLATTTVGARPAGLWLRSGGVSRGQAMVEYGAPPGARAALQWFDLQGRELGQMDLPPGEGVVRLPIRSTGVYWVRLRQGDRAARGRIVWIR